MTPNTRPSHPSSCRYRGEGFFRVTKSSNRTLHDQIKIHRPRDTDKSDSTHSIESDPRLRDSVFRVTEESVVFRVDVLSRLEDLGTFTPSTPRPSTFTRSHGLRVSRTAPLRRSGYHTLPHWWDHTVSGLQKVLTPWRRQNWIPLLHGHGPSYLTETS